MKLMEGSESLWKLMNGTFLDHLKTFGSHWELKESL